MKKFSTLCFFVVLLFSGGCQPDPKTLAKKYMALVCADHKLQQALDEAQTDKDRERLCTKSKQIHEQMDKLNAQILAKYQGNREAMEIIREVTENHQCEEE